ncbi:aminoacyl-tRNA hydrolase [Candidatus Methylocalor cossyra]|uniref:Peptidyl-tRNA hydrolase n=1 Tax=Candidatus Methylocalor cossyra TaxID=3108543 RepID=A0ABM9NK45_9GAMM
MAVNFKMVVGLGNPTAQYEHTRHNAGFWFLDEVAAHHRVALHREQRFQGVVGKLEWAGSTVLLLKPMTYMNRSGLSVGAVARYFHIQPAEILVAHDELDLAPGVVRLKRGGGHGGHNGLRDLMAHLGSPDFHRLRFGIGHPGDRAAVIAYVLGVPDPSERSLIEQAIAKAVVLLPELLVSPLEMVMNQLHAGSPPSGKKVS